MIKEKKFKENCWIGSFDPTLKVTSLLLPGTHDTMTSECQLRYYRTQYFSLQEQLNMGVRFLDIRLRREMVAAHREWISGISFDQILMICSTFLLENPSEFILMRLQNANERKDDFLEYGEALIQKIEEYSSLFYRWDLVDTNQKCIWPTIQNVRGKIIPIECSPPEMNINYINNRKWAINWHQNPHILLQDLWDAPSLKKKKEAISRLFLKSSYHSSEILFLNHISATNGELGFPDAYAEHLNSYTLEYLKQLGKPAKGVQIYDFITPEICQFLLELNFHSSN